VRLLTMLLLAYWPLLMPLQDSAVVCGWQQQQHVQQVPARNRDWQKALTAASWHCVIVQQVHLQQLLLQHDPQVLILSFASGDLAAAPRQNQQQLKPLRQLTVQAPNQP
jgi:hypothetical protein